MQEAHLPLDATTSSTSESNFAVTFPREIFDDRRVDAEAELYRVAGNLIYQSRHLRPVAIQTEVRDLQSGWRLYFRLPDGTDREWALRYISDAARLAGARTYLEKQILQAIGNLQPGDFETDD